MDAIVHCRVHLRAQGTSEEDSRESLYFYCDKCAKRFTSRKGMQVLAAQLNMVVQGDPSGCVKPPVDIKTKVPF